MSSIWRFYSNCRHVTKSPLSSAASRRLFSNIVKEDSPYVLSSLVIELDSADSPYVRRYEDMTKYQRKKLFGRASRDRPQRRGKTFSASTSGRKDIDHPVGERELIDIYQTTPVDIFRYALQGRTKLETRQSANASSTRQAETYKELGLEDGSPYVQDIRRRLVNLKSDSARKDIELFASYSEEIESELLSCKKFPILRRKVELISRTPQGCRFLNYNNRISQAVQMCRGRGDIPPRASEVTTFLMSLIARMASKGIVPGKRLCLDTLNYAVRCKSMPAIQKCLELAIQNGCKPNHSARHAIRITKHLLGVLDEKEARREFSLPWTFWRDKSLAFNDVLTILSGWDSVEAARSGIIRKPCFASLYRGSEEFTLEYTNSLAQIGAGDMLWYEWTLSHKTIEDPEANLRQAKHFTWALLNCNEVERAKKIFASYPQLAEVFAAPSTSNMSLKEVEVLTPKLQETFIQLGINSFRAIKARMTNVSKFSLHLNHEKSREERRPLITEKSPEIPYYAL